jgi:hypothetical protein
MSARSCACRLCCQQYIVIITYSLTNPLLNAGVVMSCYRLLLIGGGSSSEDYCDIDRQMPEIKNRMTGHSGYGLMRF